MVRITAVAAEEDAAYDVPGCRGHAVLRLSPNLSVMAGKPFSRALTYAEDVPENIRTWCDDVDLQAAICTRSQPNCCTGRLRLGGHFGGPRNNGARTLGKRKPLACARTWCRSTTPTFWAGARSMGGAALDAVGLKRRKPYRTATTARNRSRARWNRLVAVVRAGRQKTMQR